MMKIAINIEIEDESKKKKQVKWNMVELPVVPKQAAR
jgi:hypothetical protein